MRVLDVSPSAPSVVGILILMMVRTARAPSPATRSGRRQRNRRDRGNAACHRDPLQRFKHRICPVGVPQPNRLGCEFRLWVRREEAPNQRPQCDAMNGLGRKCHPSLSTSIPSLYPDISNTLILGRWRVISVARSIPLCPGISKSVKRRCISSLESFWRPTPGWLAHRQPQERSF